MNAFEILRNEIVQTGKRLYEKGFSPGWSGNISCKDGNNLFVTPSGENLGDFNHEDIVNINMDGKSLEEGKKPTSERFMHIEIYKIRPDFSAIIHCHAPKSSAFAVAGIPLTAPILAENVLVLGSVPIADYAMPSSKALSQNVAECFINNDAVLMANHGVVVGGKSLKEAYYKIETLEYYAEVLLWSKLLGRSTELPPNEIEKLMELRKALIH